MKIVIDIPVKTYQKIITGVYDYGDMNIIIQNGTPYEKRPRGEWIDESKDALKCSVCGKWVYKPFIGGFPTERTQHYNPNYCAFCGADMREGDQK